MQQILSNYSASISELKKSPAQIIKNANNEAVAILNHNVPSAYLVPRELYEKMMDIIDDYYLTCEVKERLANKQETIKVSLDEL
jgi:antitoxin StbD